MKYSDIKKIKEFCESLHSNPDWREVVEMIEKNEIDFEVDNVRFINTLDIDSILADELMGDEYILGSFKAEAIAYATEWPIELIKTTQEAKAFAAIGKAMSRYQVEALVRNYVEVDGYGHHFNHYDFSEEELQIGNSFYHVFDNH